MLPLLTLLALGAIVAMVVVTTSGGVKGPGIRSVASAGPRQPTPRLRPFAQDSVWNRPVDPDSRLDPRSPQLAAALLQEVDREEGQLIGPTVGFKRAGVPEYIVRRDQPAVRVALTHPNVWWRRGLARAFERVPVPSDAQPTPSGDHYLVVWQPSTDRMWEFFHFERAADGRPSAEWGGAIAHVSRDVGYYTPSAWPGARINWGASASSLPIGAGVMRISELRQRDIPHALAIGLPSPRAGVWSWPAQRTDGRSTDPLVLPEGAHLRLDPKLDIDSLGLDPVTAAIARAAQRYGMIVRDGTHHGISIYAEDPAQYGGPTVYERLFSGQKPIALLRMFPWDHLQVLPLHLCSHHGRRCAAPQGAR